MKRTTLSERALVLAPRGRDAPLAVAMLREAGISAAPCPSLPHLIQELNRGAALVVVTEEALATADLGSLAAWLADQQAWSDLPFVLLTSHGGGIERNPAARRYLDVLGNVNFVERPFHPTTLISLVRSALRGRRRQYEARARLEALREGETRLRQANQTLEQRVAERTAERDRMWRLTTDLMLVARTDGIVTAVNPAWHHQLGWSPEDMVGRTTAWLEHPDDREATRSAVEQLAAGHALSSFENRFRTRQGAHRWLSWTAAPEGEMLYATARDVTADKARQADLERTQEALRQSQKLEAIGQLTGGVAHDFNNLLTIIKSSTDLLRRPGLAEERRRRYVDAISDTVDRASKLTGQLLAFARRQALKPEVFDAARRVQAVTDMLRTIVGSRVQIVTALPQEPCFVEADVSQFETALINMAVNARDAMGGEGRLTIDVVEVAAMPPIRGHGGSPGRFVAVSLADTGHGIPEDRLSLIFEPFFTTKEVGKGTGLGLSQVFGFAKQSGGDVAVESEVGRGTTFGLYLPQAEGQRAPVKEADPLQVEAHMHGRGRRVLVVEDNVEVGRFSTQILQDLGYETVWAANGEEALRRLDEADAFDVVFSDVVMPGMSGVQLGHEIRDRYLDLPVVLTSGYSHVLAEEGRHGFELVHKPYAAEELSRVLRRVTQRRRMPPMPVPK
ncbi:response regulator [Methylobacterium iners]|uniref:histidine kinase n=1 Tax=Methylobacterium iners TaxID=418707 RepID=A0ABQ4RQU2_9HYPH|nr:response regulator [Methylobacterium iners]GJD93140.1 Sensor histidine kinase RcsC [Methylobacterium iners]